MAIYQEKPWIKKYEPGVRSNIDVPDVPLHRLLEDSARRYPENTAIIFKGTKISYRRLNELADTIASALAANGFKKGDRAVIYMANTPQFVLSYFGILKAGGIVIATNPLYSERELEHQISDCKAETIFVMSLFYDLLKKVVRKGTCPIKRVIVTNIKEYLPPHLKLMFTVAREAKDGHRIKLQSGDMWFQDFLAAGSKTSKVEEEVDPEDVALLQYTGGTTGLAKGATALHRNLVANTYALKEWVTDAEVGREVILAAIPLYHSFGMVVAMNYAILMASTLVLIPNPRDQSDLLDSINKYKPTTFPGVPALYVAINNNPHVASGKYDISSIRVCVSGSAPLLKETQETFEKLTGGKLVEGYGLTEAHVVTHANPIYGENRHGSIGLPLPGISCRIVDPELGEADMPVGEIGELIVKGPSIMQGYWQIPTETANALREGWLYTGDIARMDEDGYFYIEDRKKDMIIASGFNVYPREVEEVLIGHPAVLEVAVAGITHPKRGETVKAWIVKEPGDPATEQEIIEWSKEFLAKYKYPRMIEFRDELPRTTVGKVLKRQLIEETEQQAD